MLPSLNKVLLTYLLTGSFNLIEAGFVEFETYEGVPLAQHSKNLFVCMLFLTRPCYINSHFVHSIVELNSHNVNYILTLFPCCFITYCVTRIFQPVHAAKCFEFRILFDKYDVSKGFYRVGSNSYRKPYERECTSGFMSPSRSRLLAQVMF